MYFSTLSIIIFFISLLILSYSYFNNYLHGESFLPGGTHSLLGVSDWGSHSCLGRSDPPSHSHLGRDDWGVIFGGSHSYL